MNIVKNPAVEKHNNRWLVRIAMNIPFIVLLHKLKLGWKYQKLLCKLNLYTKYTDGRCHYCGGYHPEKFKDRGINMELKHILKIYKNREHANVAKMLDDVTFQHLGLTVKNVYTHSLKVEDSIITYANQEESDVIRGMNFEAVICMEDISEEYYELCMKMK